MTKARDAQPPNKKDTHSKNGLLISMMTQVLTLTITSFIHTERGGEREEGADPIWKNACHLLKRLPPMLKYPVFVYTWPVKVVRLCIFLQKHVMLYYYEK